MKAYIKIFGLMLVSIPMYSHANSYQISGEVDFVRIHNAAFLPQWAPPRFSFTLVGVTSAGNCPSWGPEKKIVLVGETKEDYAMVLSAFSAGKKLAVNADDGALVSGFCRANYITVGNPPPLY